MLLILVALFWHFILCTLEDTIWIKLIWSFWGYWAEIMWRAFYHGFDGFSLVKSD